MQIDGNHNIQVNGNLNLNVSGSLPVSKKVLKKLIRKELNDLLKKRVVLVRSDKISNKKPTLKAMLQNILDIDRIKKNIRTLTTCIFAKNWNAP